MRRSIYKRKWYVQKCGTEIESEPCWCRMIVISSYNEIKDDIEDCVVCAGELNEKLANHIVKVHNDSLKKHLSKGRIKKRLLILERYVNAQI